MNMEGDAGLRLVSTTSPMRRRSRPPIAPPWTRCRLISHVDRIVEEANHAFHLNMNMFKELEGNLVAAIGKVLLFLPAVSGPAARRLLLRWLPES